MEGEEGIPEVAEVAETVTVEQDEGKVGETRSPDLVERGEALLDQGVEVARQGLAREAAEIVEQLGIGMVKEGIEAWAVNSVVHCAQEYNVLTL